MRSIVKAVLAASAILVLGSGTARACQISGKIFCSPGGLPLGGVVIQLYDGDPASGGTPIAGGSVTTGDDGSYALWAADVFGTAGWPANTFALPILGAGASLVSPTGAVALSDSDVLVQDWVVSDPERCSVLGCWLTGGGAKLSRITNTTLAEKGPKISFGGNVNPGCSPTAGSGGNWNHLDRDLGYHFQVQAIQVIECGNVDGIPPGSTSPVTPYNYILWQGQGRAVKPVNGDIEKGDPVCFRGKAEDRNEPGSSGAKDGAQIDRYYFEVFDCGTNVSLYALGTEAAPLPITDGNLQIHVSSCDTPP